MTDFAIQEQIKTIKKVTTKASKSKEAALKFLIDAGIIREEKAENTKEKQTLKKKKS